MDARVPVADGKHRPGNRGIELMAGILNDAQLRPTRDFGTREDGTPKGYGYFGLLKAANGDDMTELSVGIEIDGVETLVPSIVPTLDDAEVAYLRAGGDPRQNETIMQKAQDHATQRIEGGLSPFFD